MAAVENSTTTRHYQNEFGSVAGFRFVVTLLASTYFKMSFIASLLQQAKKCGLR